VEKRYEREHRGRASVRHGPVTGKKKSKGGKHTPTVGKLKTVGGGVSQHEPN